MSKSRELLPYVAALAERELGREPLRMIETQVGLSTLVFLSLGWRVCSVASNERTFAEVTAHAETLGVPLDAWERQCARSEVAFPSMVGRDFDVALIGGRAGWPTVFVEFCYANITLRQGGILLLDNAHLHSVRELVDLLEEQPGYHAVRSFSSLRALRKATAARYLPDVEGQPYLASQKETWSAGPRQPRPEPPPQWDEMHRRREAVLTSARALLEAGRIEEGRVRLQEIAVLDIFPDVLDQTDPWLREIAGGRRIVATTDPSRKPADDEVVVIYGNYPLSSINLVSNNPIRRHCADFGRLEQDIVESDPRWTSVDRIFVINRDDRVDRWEGVMRELSRAHAPLDRVERVPASLPSDDMSGVLAGQVACLRSHLGIVERVAAGPWNNVMIVEDDFCFTSDIESHLEDLATFLNRDYGYWVCLLATHHWGPVVPVDDVVAESHQTVTATAGYLLSRPGAAALEPVYRQAEPLLASTGEEFYTPDRCWAVLQPSGRFLVFRRKPGMQASSFSDISGKVTRYRF